MDADADADADSGSGSDSDSDCDCDSVFDHVASVEKHMVDLLASAPGAGSGGSSSSGVSSSTFAAGLRQSLNRDAARERFVVVGLTDSGKKRVEQVHLTSTPALIGRRYAWEPATLRPALYPTGNMSGFEPEKPVVPTPLAPKESHASPLCAIPVPRLAPNGEPTPEARGGFVTGTHIGGVSFVDHQGLMPLRKCPEKPIPRWQLLHCGLNARGLCSNTSCPSRVHGKYTCSTGDVCADSTCAKTWGGEVWFSRGFGVEDVKALLASSNVTCPACNKNTVTMSPTFTAVNCAWAAIITSPSGADSLQSSFVPSDKRFVINACSVSRWMAMSDKGSSCGMKLTLAIVPTECAVQFARLEAADDTVGQIRLALKYTSECYC